jgi:hypothetical protein
MFENEVKLENSSQITSSVLPIEQKVQAGISDDIVTEIVSGLNEGDQIISKKITQNGTNNNTQSSNSGSGAKIGGSAMGGSAMPPMVR